jgi:hypothetical protein
LGNASINPFGSQQRRFNLLEVLEVYKWWYLLLKIGLWHSISWTNKIFYVFSCVETLGPSKVQIFCLVDNTK